jgi:murein DD-endopeptidase MepM/ murein hydrolase activator NlpD
MKISKPFSGFIAADYPKGSVTQWFAENPVLYAQAVPGLKGHNGMDFVAPWGTQLYAVEDAVVYDTKDDAGGYGKYVRLMATDKVAKEKREWTYGHLSFIKCKAGDKVKAGDTIGLMGNTGFVISDNNGNGFWHYNPYAGTHLHLGLRKYNLKGQIQNYPGDYLGSVDYKDMLDIPEAPKYASDDPVWWAGFLNLLKFLKNNSK